MASNSDSAVVAERGEPGTAYNVGDRRVCTLQDVLDLIAEVLDTSVEFVHASRRDLPDHGLDPGDVILYHHPATGYPHVLATHTIRSIGWDATPVTDAMARTIEERLDHVRTTTVAGPDRDVEQRLLADLAG